MYACEDPSVHLVLFFFFFLRIPVHTGTTLPKGPIWKGIWGSTFGEVVALATEPHHYFRHLFTNSGYWSAGDWGEVQRNSTDAETDMSPPSAAVQPEFTSFFRYCNSSPLFFRSLFFSVFFSFFLRTKTNFVGPIVVVDLLE